MSNYITKHLIKWLTTSLFLTIFVPVFAVWLSQLIIEVELQWYNAFIVLFYKGIYLFIGINMLFSLFNDYEEDTKDIFTPPVYGFIFFVLLVIIFLFISSIGLVNSVPLEENIKVYIFSTILSVFASIYIKFKILKFKFKKNYHYVY